MTNTDQQKLIQELVDKTMRELNTPKQPLQKSRVWQDPEGFQYLGVWQNAALLRVMVRKFTLTLPLKPPLSEYRLKTQMDDEIRSVIRNIEEGWKRATTIEYLQFLGYSQASLEELRGDIRDCRTDGFLKSIKGSCLLDLGIDLRVYKGPAQVKGDPASNPNHPYYQPLTTLNPNTLTYEIFTELINKTDYLLRVLVQSLEEKLSKDQKYYQVEQAKIKSKLYYTWTCWTKLDKQPWKFQIPSTKHQTNSNIQILKYF